MSLIIKFKTWKELTKYKNNVHHDLNEGVMIKLKKVHIYQKKKGYWYNGKNPKLVDAILMYVNEGMVKDHHIIQILRLVFGKKMN